MATNPTTTLPRLNLGSMSNISVSSTPSYTSFFSPETVTSEQYLGGGIDFYTQTLGTGIQSTVPIEEEDQEEEEVTAPDIFRPIGEGGREDVGQTALQNALRGGLENVELYNAADLNPMSISYDLTSGVATGAYKGSTAVDPKTGKTTLKQKGDLVSDFFDNFTSTLKASSAQQAKKGLTFSDMGDPITAVGPTGKQRAIGLPPAMSLGLSVAGLGVFSGLAAIGGAANMAVQQQNAARIKAIGGGAFMDVNGMMVSRAPGSFTYSGNLMGMSQEQMRNVEAIRRGYVPGTLQLETFDPVTGKYGSATGVRDVIEAKDFANTKGGFTETGAWRDLAGNTSTGTVKEQTEAYTDAVNSKAGLSGNFKVTKDQIMNAVKSVQTSWSLTKGTHVTPGTPTAIDLINDLTNSARQKQQEAEMNAAEKTLAGISGRGEEDRTRAEVEAEEKTIEKMAETGKVPADVKAEIEKAMKEQTGGGDDKGRDNSRGNAGDRGDPGDVGKGKWASGGRVGYQAGGEAGFAQRPEFVGGNQTQPDGVSVADDQPRDVQEGTFVINAAAADFAGRGDIEKMLRDAYKRVGDTGQSGVSQEVQISVSKGEVIIPPHIAKEIGYDRLNKINNRGKKEIARRQEAARGGFIDRKKYAKGDRVTVYRGEPLDPSKVTATDYGYGKEDVGKFHTPSVKKAQGFARGAGKGNQVIKSRKVTIEELFDGVEEAWKTQAKKKTDYFAKMPKSELNKNIKFVRNLKKDVLSGKRSIETLTMFLQEQVFHDDKSKINFIETFKNDPKSAGKLAGRALTKVATKATPPLAILGVAAEIFTPSQLGDATLNNDSFLNYSFTPSK
jgi:hypothetical protein